MVKLQLESTTVREATIKLDQDSNSAEKWDSMKPSGNNVRCYAGI
jgi:hypothetical protein